MEATPSALAYAWKPAGKAEQENGVSNVCDRFVPSRADLDRHALLDLDMNKQSYSESDGATCKSPYAKLLQTQSPEKKSLFSFKAPGDITADAPFEMSPFAGDAFPQTPTKPRPRIDNWPRFILDAPQLQDDFYLNLLDWSSTNVIAIGLTRQAFLWHAATKKVSKLCEVSGQEDKVTALRWCQRGTALAVGVSTGEVQLYDAATRKKLRCMLGHRRRVGALSWNGSLLTSGSQDSRIVVWDVRTPQGFVSRVKGHSQEVCGLEWSYDELHLASGGNDNRVCVWSLKTLSSSPEESRAAKSSKPMLCFDQHKAAVKALAWSPHRSGVLASGGGTQDQCIRMWSTTENRLISCTKTGSQVCNMVFSKNTKELVTTHGYSNNEINLWSLPSMKKVTTLWGHTYRVLYLAMSPDGQMVATGAGDETLRLWNLFPGTKPPSSSSLNMETPPLFRTIR